MEFDNEGKNNYRLKNQKSFRWLKIEDYNMFGVLVAGTKKTKKMKQDYARLEIVVNDSKYANLQNISVEKYKIKVQEIFNYLDNEYGIIANIENILLRQMEINCTFRTYEEFNKYHRLIRLWMYNLPQSFKKLGQISGINRKEQRLESEMFFRGNSLTQIKIYDKKKQLEETKGIKLKDNVMRIELTLKKSQKITEAFQTNKLSDITDEDVYRYFYKQFLRLFELPFRKWQKENITELKRMLIKHKRKSKNYWATNLLSEARNREQMNQIPILLDINDLFEQIKMLDRTGRHGRVEKGILEKCHYDDVFLQNDSTKAEEIIKKIHLIYDEFCKCQEVEINKKYK